MDPEPMPAATSPAATSQADGALWLRAAGITRGVAIGGLASLIGGILVVGIGGRSVMRILALANPGATGAGTTAGARIGDITFDGTLILIVLIGTMAGGVAGVVWSIAAPWLPGRGARRAVASALAAVSLGSFLVVRSDEADFQVIEPGLAIALFVVLFAGLGSAISTLDEWLGRRLPKVAGGPPIALVGYVVVVALGLVFVSFALAAYFARSQFPTESAPSFAPPIEVGVALVVVTIATVVSWCVRVTKGPTVRPLALVVAGRGGLAIGVGLGAIRLAREVSDLLAT